jgi:uncharacterized repeat protein (TIGR02543 family)
MKQTGWSIPAVLCVSILAFMIPDSATCAPAAYSVTYDANGATSGAAPVDSTRYTKGQNVTVKDRGSLQKTGNAFMGWITSLSGKSDAKFYSSGGVFTMGAANVVLYAVWWPNAYAVSFDTRGGTPIETQNIFYGSKAKAPKSPVRDGCVFTGWYKDPECHKPWNFANEKVMGDVTLYAKWDVYHNVMFSYNAEDITGVMDYQKIFGGHSAKLTPCAYAKAGWSFAGWASTSSGDVVYKDGAVFTMGDADVTLYAKWTANSYKIKFDRNDADASGAMADQTVSCGSSANLAQCAFGKAGWSFTGWATAKTGVVIYGDGEPFSMGPADVTLYAKWWSPTAGITAAFDSQGGGPVAPQMIGADGKAQEPAVPVYAAHALEGWFKEPACATRWDFGSDSAAASITLYAKWLDSAEGLYFARINENEYRIYRCKSDASGTVIVPAYWAGRRVAVIGRRAFEGCTMSGLAIPDSIKVIEDQAFTQCDLLTDVTLPDSVVSIGGFAFAGCSSLSSVRLPGGITALEDGVFSSCPKLAGVELPGSLVKIGSSLFQGCSGLISLNIPQGVKAIPERLCNGCVSLESVTIPSGVISIGEHAFSRCEKLAGVTIPSGVKSIGKMAFGMCFGLAGVTVDAVRPPAAGEQIFYNCNKLKAAGPGAIKVPAASLDKYKGAPGWFLYQNLMVGQ